MVINLRKHRWKLRVLGILLICTVFVLNSPWFWKKFYPFNYQQSIIDEAEINELDPLFVAAVIKAESGFHPSAVSNKGAVGLMQIMPDTGKWIAEQKGIEKFDQQKLYIPETNIQFGCWYLKTLFKEFEGNKVLVLAAYNGGRGNVQQWLKDNRISRDAQTSAGIPFGETQAYVDRVMKNYKMYQKLYTQDLNE